VDSIPGVADYNNLGLNISDYFGDYNAGLAAPMNDPVNGVPGFAGAKMDESPLGNINQQNAIEASMPGQQFSGIGTALSHIGQPGVFGVDYGRSWAGDVPGVPGMSVDPATAGSTNAMGAPTEAAYGTGQYGTGWAGGVPENGRDGVDTSVGVGTVGPGESGVGYGGPSGTMGDGTTGGGGTGGGYGGSAGGSDSGWGGTGAAGSESGGTNDGGATAGTAGGNEGW
jgi:hypothetical protein